MSKRFGRRGLKRFLGVGVMLGLLAAAAIGPAASAGRSTDPNYDFSLGAPLSDGTPSAITSDGALYSEPLDASGSYWNMNLLGARSFKVTLRDSDRLPLMDNSGQAAVDYSCVAGSYLFTDTNPFVSCYADREQTRGFVLDYPPYGNATKQTMKLACAVVSHPDTSTYVSEAPATGCPAKVSLFNGGRNAPT